LLLVRAGDETEGPDYRGGVLRVGVLVSGSGTLLQAILDAAGKDYEVAVVLSDRPGVKALERAVAAGVPTAVVDWSGPSERADFSARVAKALLEHSVDLVAQAGFMRILTAEYFDALAPRPILNSHPALLPAFKGAHAVRDALEAGVKETGTTIHIATLEVDSGPILAQEVVPIERDDTEETLHERIKAVEQRLYPEVIAGFANG
jgi:phosphoribosylglycinamide formyltransferase 1